MATQLQIRRGTTAQMNAFTGAEGELAVNTTTDTVHVHDGSTAGGFALAKADGSNIGTYAGSFTTLAASGAVTLSSTLAVTGAATMGGATFSGNVGIGSGANPISHQFVSYKTGANANYIQIASGSTGIGATNGFRLGVSSAGLGEIYSQSASPTMTFSSGNVGIGVSSLNNPLEVAVTPNTASKTSGSAFDGAAIRLSGNLSTTNSESAIIAGLDGGIQAGIGFMRESVSSWGSVIKFYTRQAAVVDLDGVAERMRISSSGNLLVGTTNGSGGITLHGEYANQGLITLNTTATGADFMYFVTNANNVVGRIASTATATAYNTSSDYRLKEDDVPMTGATERVKALRPINFAWKVDGSRVDGFLAHEVQDVVPEAITGTKDAMRDEEYEVTPAVLDDDGNVTTEAVMGTRSVPDYQGIDQSKLVPLLVATIQELEARLTALENN